MEKMGPGIVALGECLPEEIRSNDDFRREFGLETTDAWIRKRTGIINRHVAAPDVHVPDLAAQAAKEALAMIGMRPSELEQIYVASATPKVLFPYAGNSVQRELSEEIKTPSMDLGNACNGGLAGLEIAYGMVAAGFRANAMVIGAEVLTKFVDPEDRRTCVLFGDGAAAVIVKPVKNPGPYAFAMGSDGAKGNNITFEGGGSAFPATEKNIEDGRFKIKMDGPAVYKDAVRYMQEMAERVLRKAELPKSAVDWLIPHQANLRIMEAVAGELGMKDKMISYIENIGNTSAASIFIAMNRAFRDGWLQKGDIIAMAAIGSGYNFGGGVIQWNIVNPTPRPAGKFSDRSKQ